MRGGGVSSIVSLEEEKNGFITHLDCKLTIFGSGINYISKIGGG